ncbi:MAG: hypothetical protein OQJ96_11560 [Flavobacteriales bacterium]|nr:hypothetical protein [Flavobacteriales bacterium]MCW8913300.1 hypothetical protein [Flavobacteriales bacterium]MCW8938352.1 hypothetical protein [Flavobacteriales bacterium]MCW8940311.1 hypothetical protein [Flavobacteriales bacterium]MCW8969261.1 hypothetical protein [Flavobacteriales bacterium]
MKLKIFTIVVSMLVANSLLLGQKTIEVFGGGSYNYLFDGGDLSNHYMSEYKNGNGFVLGGAIEEIKTDWIKWRFTLHYEKYNGAFKISDGSLGGGYTNEATFDKSIIALGLYPLNIKVTKNLLINFGIIISRMINENIKGVSYRWVMNKGLWSYPIDNSKRYSNRGMIGFQTRLAYQIKLSENFALLPQYHFYYGVSSEFKITPTKAMRHYFNIGISKTINTKKEL